MPVGITFRLTLWKALASFVLGALAMGVAVSIIGHDTDGDLNSYSRFLLYTGGVLMLTGIVGLFVLCCLFCESCSWSNVKQELTSHYQMQQHQQQEKLQQQQRQQPTQQLVKVQSCGLKKQQRTESRLPLLECGDEPQPGPFGEHNPVFKRGSSDDVEAESSDDESVKFENNFRMTLPYKGHCTPRKTSRPESFAGERYKSCPRPSGKANRFTILTHQTCPVRGLPGGHLLDSGSEDSLVLVHEQIDESQC